MSLALYQIVVLIFAFLMISQGIKHYLKRESGQTLLKLAVRIFIWGGMAIVVAFPNISNTLASFIGIEGNINAVILTGFLLVFLMIFKLLSAIERLEQQISVVIRNHALSDIQEKKD